MLFPNSLPSILLYLIRSWISRSANPITPKPIFLVDLVIFSISGVAYWLASITLSKKWTDVFTTFSNSAQSTSLWAAWKNLAKLIEPKLHDSFPSKGCSPQGFVAIISPYSSVTWLSLFTLSKKIIPGSPFLQAP